MNTYKLPVSVLMLVSVLLSACAPAATPPVPTAVPPISAPTIAPTDEVSITPPTAKVIAEWEVANPSGVFIGFDSVWVPGHHDKTTTRIDPDTNKVIAVIQGTGWRAEPALAVGDVLWVTGQLNDTTWIDPKTNTVTKTVPPVKGSLHSIAYGFNSLWFTTGDNKLNRVDPATSQIITSIKLEDGSQDINNGVFVTTAAVWVYQPDKAEVIKIDPATNSVVSKTPWITLIDEAKAQTIIPAGKGTDFLWISVAGDEGGGGIPAGLLRIDPITGAGLTFLPLSAPQLGTIAVTDNAVWVAGSSQINRVNVATNQIDATYVTDPGAIQCIVIGFGSVWVVNYQLNLVQRLDIAP